MLLPHFFFALVVAHLAHDAVLHVCFLVAALFAHERDLQLTEGFGQDVALGEELPPLDYVGLQQRCVVLVAQHPLPWQQMQAKVKDETGRTINTYDALTPVLIALNLKM